MQPFPLPDIVDVQFIASLCQDTRLKVIGNPRKKIMGVASLEEAQGNDLAFCSAIDADGGIKIEKSKAGAVVCHESALAYLSLNDRDRVFLLAENPMREFNRCLKSFFKKEKGRGIHDSVQIGDHCEVHETAAIGANSVIGKRVIIGSHTIIDSCVVIRDGVTIGSGVFIGPNSSIGIEGLAYTTDEHGSYENFMHLGSVIIEDNVDIGASTCVVRGILQNTLIGKGSKIGNHVNIGHNVSIGADCFISAGAVLCGSVNIEDNCWIAPHASILNHKKIGKGATVGLGAVVIKDVLPGMTVVGNPAKTLKRK
jgi:UDP-3-O-[3-hydroxymyristoyl] glucosamine N-acyltransferase